jgi:cell wall-associated NlpC family hydrolase
VQGAVLAPITTGVLSSGHWRRMMLAFTAAAIAIALIFTVAPQATDARTRTSERDRVILFARSHIGARFRMGTEGMRTFDCSGLVFRVYTQARLINRIGGRRLLSTGYFKWFKQRGLVSRSNGKPGDLVWWTHRGRIEHIGLYVGNGKAISALLNPWGVKKHTLGGVRAKFLAFGHVRLDRKR